MRNKVWGISFDKDIERQVQEFADNTFSGNFSMTVRFLTIFALKEVWPADPHDINIAGNTNKESK